ncbi:nucleoside deaminase [Tautonia plasticadhaerens]|uniref:Guanine deaminase n=1 Tax=Tautonia plasticadhaerens TaxID=2527974 RepID=A0A518GZ73_9BACT|nr:nucleoside deaminase [Tautonia plasticadhaerens]QDV33881.1 Guanine deaminase [Tautonia plasticadhaerens]
MNSIPFSRRRGRLRIRALLVMVGTLSGVGVWMVQGTTPGRAMTLAQVPSDTPRVSAEELASRFPEETHEAYLRRAIANSRRAGVEYKTGGAFGAVVVDRYGNVLADGLNHVVAQNDPTWHAEMHAIRQACALLKSPKLDGCILYTSSEPCPMCLATAYWAGVDGIYYAATVADSKEYGNFDDDFIYDQFSRPIGERAIPQQELLRPEAVEVWKEYAARPDKVDY